MSPFVIFFVTLCVFSFESCLAKKPRSALPSPAPLVNGAPSCVCGVYLSSQMVGDSIKPDDDTPPLAVMSEDEVVCGSTGFKDCSRKCVDEIIPFLPKSPKLICGSIDRDVFNEKAHLFVNVCDQGWTKTRLSAQKRICCKNSIDYKCPV